ncbi:MAG: DUF547 domain-containing protein [Myxococcota bacterium]
MTGILLSTLAIAGAAPFDHDHKALTHFLEGAVSSKGVDYRVLASRKAQLERYLDTVAAVDASGFTKHQRLALYVNAYNGYTLKLMLDEGPPKSITDLDGGKVWDTRQYVVAGEKLTLNQMEHGKARKLTDGRVHAVVNCASKGCPPLPPQALSANRVEDQLNAAARTWARTNAFSWSGNTVRLSSIFDWYGEDFASADRGDLAGVDGKPEDALWFLSRYVDPSTKDRLLSGSIQTDWQVYDWSLNQR